MIAKELYLDNKGNYLYLLLEDNIRIPVSVFSPKLKFENIVICKNGVIRGKPGFSLPRKVIEDKENF